MTKIIAMVLPTAINGSADWTLVTSFYAAATSEKNYSNSFSSFFT